MGVLAFTTLVLAVSVAGGQALPVDDLLPAGQLPDLPVLPVLPVEPPVDPPVAKPPSPPTPAPATTPTAAVPPRDPVSSQAGPRVRRRARTQPPGRSPARATPTPRSAVARAAPRDDGGATQRSGASPDVKQQGIAGDVVDLVEALPAALLWALVGIATIALGLAGNAFWQSRQRAALRAQRLLLLDDIGLLSRALLPPVPEFDGLAVSAAYRPADGPAAGGDFYDVFCLDDDRVGVLLGDISGHGRDSVTLAALARFTLRTLLADGRAPGDALARADRMLERDLRPHFVTVIAAIYDRRTRRLTYAKAGHAPPIVLGAAHDPDAETPACPLGVGVGVGTVWPEFHVDLSDGVSVCLVTDGLEEAKRGAGRLGRAEIERLVAAQEHPDAEQLLNDVRELADQVSDDTAAVVLARA